ncbi:MAG: DUF2000 domain-containing protein [archaeon]
MTYDYRSRKIVAILSEALPPGKAMNALGHLAFAAGHASDESWMGQKIITDTDGQNHAGISKYPFIILKATPDEIKEIIHRAKRESILIIDYPQEMFDTGADDELVTAIQSLKNETATYHAAVLVGEAGKINKLTSHLKLYR